MKIVYYPQNLDGGGCYRCVYPGTQLKARGGHDVGMCNYTILHADDTKTVMQFHLDPNVEADLLVIQQPGHDEYVDLIQSAQARGIKVVVDVDDDYINIPSYNAASKAKGHLKNLTWCLRHADALTVTTPALRDSMSNTTSAPIYVLRNFLDWRAWKDTPPVYENRTWEKLRIGYMGTIPYHGGDLEVLKPWLGKWMEEHPDVEFVSVGDDGLHEALGIPEAQRVCVDRFVFRLQRIAQYVANMDIGLIPLVRNQFNEAKSHLKGMEYAGVGVPCLATPTESYRDWWLSGSDEATSPGTGSGFMCDRPEEWIRALDRLYEDRELVTRLGRNARKQAEKYTYQNHWRLWENAYHEILGTAPTTQVLTSKSRQAVDPFGVVL